MRHNRRCYQRARVKSRAAPSRSSAKRGAHKSPAVARPPPGLSAGAPPSRSSGRNRSAVALGNSDPSRVLPVVHSGCARRRGCNKQCAVASRCALTVRMAAECNLRTVAVAVAAGTCSSGVAKLPTAPPGAGTTEAGPNPRQRSDSMPTAARDPATPRKTDPRARSAIPAAMMMMVVMAAIAGCSARSCPNGVPTLHGKPIVCGGCTCTPTKWYQIF